MWIRCGKVKHWTLHLQREFGRWSSVSYQSYSTVRRPLTHLKNSVTEAKIYLVGVDHVSSKSVEHVRHVIRHHKPNVVAVELCEKRAVDILSGRKPKLKGWRDFFSMEGSFRERLFEFTIGSIYAYIANSDEGPLPGDEMRVAIEEGTAIRATVLYMDKDSNVIASNVSKELSLWKFLMFFFRNQRTYKQCYPNLHGAALRINHAFDKYLSEELSMRELREQADAMFEPGVLEEAIAVGDKYFPGLMKAFLHERNEHMVQRLRKMEGNVVAVVGAAHVPGMCDLWQDAEIRVEESNASF